MCSTDVSVEKMLFELGWSGVSPLTTMAEITLAFVAAGLDTAAVVRRVDGVVGEDGDGAEDCVRVIGIFLDEAQRSGRLECLRRPGTRDTVDVLDALARLRGGDGEIGQGRNLPGSGSYSVVADERRVPDTDVAFWW